MRSVGGEVDWSAVETCWAGWLILAAKASSTSFASSVQHPESLDVFNTLERKISMSGLVVGVTVAQKIDDDPVPPEPDPGPLPPSDPPIILPPLPPSGPVGPG